MTKLKIAVIYGGPSPEHEVSIITAVQAMAAMPKDYEVIPLYVTKDGAILTGPQLFSLDSYRNLPFLSQMAEHVSLPTTPNTKSLSLVRSSFFAKNQARPFDVLFPCFHGGVGEGGWIQGLAEYYQIPLVGTGLTGAALGMDKVAMKAAFAGAGIKQAPYLWISRHNWQAKKESILRDILSTFSYPIFVKPSRGGSSIGTTCVKTKTELSQAIDLASGLDTRIVIEEGITSAREINISIMGNAGSDLECSVCEEVFHQGSEFLDFTVKYIPRKKDGIAGTKSEGMASTDKIIPAKIDKALESKIQEIAKIVFNLLDCSGLVRLDFLIKGNAVYCIEINTIPGLLSYYLWGKSGYTYSQLLDHLIKLALDKHAEVKKNVLDFASPILSNIAPGSKLGNKLQS